jgi:hypothetical protein
VFLSFLEIWGAQFISPFKNYVIHGLKEDIRYPQDDFKSPSYKNAYNLLTYYHPGFP